MRKFDQFQEGTSMLAWCRSIVRVQVLLMKQQRQREQTLVERLLDDAIDAAFEEFHAAQGREDAELWRQALERCLQQVPERGRRVLEARFAEELGYPEIGERIGHDALEHRCRSQASRVEHPAGESSATSATSRGERIGPKPPKEAMYCEGE